MSEVAVPQVVWSGSHFEWRNATEFPVSAQRYLQHYLDRLARYRPIGLFQQSPVYSLYQPPPASPAGRRSLAMRIQRKITGARIPATATLAVNKACQCDCEHCSAADYNASEGLPLSTPTLKAAIAETIDLGASHIILLGGEPLLRKDLCEIIASVDATRATVILFTNGEFLTPKACKNLRDAGLMGAFVSLDCADAAKHDAFRRRPGLYAKAVAGLHHLQAAGLLAGLSTHLSASRMRENGFFEMMELGRMTGAHEVTFFDAIPSGRWLRENHELLQPEHRIEIARWVREFRNRPGYPAISAQSTLTSECGSAFCFAANTQFYLTASGEMCPCDFTPLTIGRYPQRSIAELWQTMISTPPYNVRAKSCRMQNQAFREEIIFPHLDRGGRAPYLISPSSPEHVG